MYGRTLCVSNWVDGSGGLLEEGNIGGHKIGCDGVGEWHERKEDCGLAVEDGGEAFEDRGGKGARSSRKNERTIGRFTSAN